MLPPVLHSYLLWRSSVEPDAKQLTKWRYTAAASLIPAIMVGVVVFGWYAGLLVVLSLSSALVTDLLCWRYLARGAGHPVDAYWPITGLLVAMMLPPCAPWWVPVLGAGVAMALGRYYLSVDGMPLLQPAAVGLLLMNVLFAGAMHPSVEVGGQRVSAWPTLAWPFGFPTTEESDSRTEPQAREDVGRSMVQQFLRLDVRRAVDRQRYLDDLFAHRQPMYDAENGVRADAVFGPRPLDLAREHPRTSLVGLSRSADRYEWLDMLLYVPGTIGGSSGLALLFGLCLLVFARAVSMLTPLLALFVLFAGLTITSNANVAVHLLSGPTLLGFFYLAADPTCAPRSRRGRALSGIFTGMLEWVLRLVMVEAAVFTAVAAQAFSFVLDQYVAPPREEPQASHARMSITSLGRL